MQEMPAKNTLKPLFFCAFFTFQSIASPQNPALSVTAPLPVFEFGTKTLGATFTGQEASPTSSTTLWSLGFSSPFSLEKIGGNRAGFSLTLEGPYGSLRTLRAYNSDDLYPVRYGLSDSQFQAQGGLGLEVLPQTLFVGAGIQFFLSAAGNSEASLSTTNPTGRLALDVGLNSAIYSGVLFHQDRSSLSFVYVQEMNPEFIQKFDARAPIGGEETFHQPLTAKSHLYFEPHRFNAEASYDLHPLTLGLGAEYQLWSRYRHPVLLTETVDTRGTSSATTPPDTKMRDTWNPYLDVKYSFIENLEGKLKYQYQPSAVSDSSGVGNPVDLDTHIVQIGISQTLLYPFFMKWQVHLERHFMNDRTVTKTASNSSYTLGGSAYAVGVTLGFGM